jgi:hypothetical protein
MKINPVFRYSVALACAGYGYAVGKCVPLVPYFRLHPIAASNAEVVCQIVGVLVAGAACLIENSVVFRIGWLWWSMRDLCRHVIILGDIGSGKTMGAFNFILRQYLKNVPHGGAFIVGTKGDEGVYALQCAQAFGREKDFRLLEVKPDDAPSEWVPRCYYNLVSDRSLPWSTLAKAVVDTASANTEGHQSSFFKPSAQKAIAYGLQLLDALKRPVNLRALHDLLADTDKLNEALEEYDKDIKRVKDLEGDRIRDFFAKEFLVPKGKDQSAGQEATVSLFLSPFLTPEIADVFCSENANTFELDDLDTGMILATAIPQRLFAERQFVHTYLKTLVYYRALRRLDKPWYIKRTMNSIGIFADELQDIVTASEDGMADHKIAATIRAAKVFIVGAMQSEFSPDPKIQEEKRKVLMKNLCTRFYFKPADAEDALQTADFLGKKTITRRYRANVGVITAGNSGNQEEVHRVKPDKLRQLPDFTCYVVHPSPTSFSAPYRRVRMAPILGNGRLPSWYRLGAFANLFNNGL